MTSDDATGGGAGPIGPGRFLDGRYRITSALGEGGMGSVYLADDEKMGRKVVVKVPHVTFLAEKGFRERFEKEIRSLTSLEHPHVVKALDAGSVGDVPYAVLQYLPGGSLKARIAKAGGRMTPAEICAWLPAVAEALDFIHEQGVVHRDVKPGNILFDAKGHVFLADFGIAKALEATETGLTQTGATPGSPDYMGPEVLTGGALGAAYDQYALAVVVYQALSGRLPHSAETPLRLLYAKASHPPAPILGTATALNAEVVATLLRALSREPDERYRSCSVFAKAFFRTATAEPSESASAQAPQNTVRTRPTSPPPAPPVLPPPPPPRSKPPPLATPPPAAPHAVREILGELHRSPPVSPFAMVLLTPITVFLYPILRTLSWFERHYQGRVGMLEALQRRALESVATDADRAAVTGLARRALKPPFTPRVIFPLLAALAIVFGLVALGMVTVFAPSGEYGYYRMRKVGETAEALSGWGSVLMHLTMTAFTIFTFVRLRRLLRAEAVLARLAGVAPDGAAEALKRSMDRMGNAIFLVALTAVILPGVADVFVWPAMIAAGGINAHEREEALVLGEVEVTHPPGS